MQSLLRMTGALTTIIGLSLCLPITVQAKETQGTAQSTRLKGSTGTVEFRVAAPDLKRISKARVIVIDKNGKVVSSGVTDSRGTWLATLRPELDQRFKQVRPMGTVTALVLAHGYNEEVEFEVPVFPGSIQPVMMIPIAPNRRNEPQADLGNLHRHDIMRMIDAYAREQGLTRQPSVAGEKGYAPWSPQPQGRG